MVNPWLQFVISAAVIVYAGSKLTGSAAVVADKTGFGTAWAGALMLPLATSMPELVTTFRAAAINAPDLAVGNILGSCLYNLALLALIDLLEGRSALTSRIKQGHIITASMSIITISLASIGMIGITQLRIGWIGLETLLIVIIYIFGGRLIFRYEKKNLDIIDSYLKQQEEDKSLSAGRALLHFIIAGVFIVAAGVLLTDAADIIAVQSKLGHTFVGSIFLAISTSLPETVTTISAVKLRHLDMAVANVFGANFMNLFIISLTDLVYRQGPLLHDVSDFHFMSAIFVILLTAVMIFGLIYRSRKFVLCFGFDTLIVLLGYITLVYLLYSSGGN
ncbi:MAG: sodium:calcium antiporter [Bacillota bacterium]|nr:sodium:calcium antiporter [Bacillota bacterium]